MRALFASKFACILWSVCKMSNGLDCSYDWFMTSGYVGAVSSVAAIVLILCSKAYKDFFHRLYLYIATSALVLSVCWCVEQVIPIPETDQLGDSVESVFNIIGLALIFFSSSLIALVTCWLSFHVFLMVTCGVTSLKKWPFEIAGIILVLGLSLPFTATSIWLLYILFYPTCKSDLVVVAMANIVGSPFYLNTGVSIFGITFISIATIALIIRSFCSTQLNGGVRKFYRQALKAALPFLLLQICWFLFGFVIASIHMSYFLSLSNDTYQMILNGLIIFISLYPCSFVLLPLLLLCQPQVTRNLKCRRGRGRGREEEDHSETAPFSHWSTEVTSRTHFIVPPESVFTEQDPLVIRQETGNAVV